MIKQTFFHALIGLFILTSYGCALPNASNTHGLMSSDSTDETIDFKRDALSAYYSAVHAMRQAHTGDIQLMDIQGQWINNNLQGEWEYSFAADNKQWIYNAQGLRLTQALKHDFTPAKTPLNMNKCISELSAYLEIHPPPTGSEKHLAAVLWTPALGWVYKAPLESNSQ